MSDKIVVAKGSPSTIGLTRSSATAEKQRVNCPHAPFLRYGDILAKNYLFFLPLSHSAPSLPIFPLEFCGEVKREETRVMRLSYSEDPMMIA